MIDNKIIKRIVNNNVLVSIPSFKLLEENLEVVIPILACGIIIGLAGASFILYMDANTNSRESQLERWEPISIPRDRRNDLFYLKLGYQFVVNVCYPESSKTLYNRNWAWATLTRDDQIRLECAAAGAKATGALQSIGYDRQRRGKIVHINTDVKAKSRFNLILVIRQYDTSVNNYIR